MGENSDIWYMAVNCNEGTLSPYIPDQDNPWDISKILFLFRRIYGFI